MLSQGLWFRAFEPGDTRHFPAMMLASSLKVTCYFRFLSLGFRVSGLGCRVSGLGFRVYPRWRFGMSGRA